MFFMFFTLEDLRILYDLLKIRWSMPLMPLSYFNVFLDSDID